MKQISDNIYQVKVPMRWNPLGYTHSYLLKEAATLIDTGVRTGEAFKNLSQQLRQAGLEISDVRKLIATHLHGDHVGLMNQIRYSSGAKIYAHVEALKEKQVQKGRDRAQEYMRELKLLGGTAPNGLLSRITERIKKRQMRVFQIDKSLMDGQILELKGSTLKIIHTPGHAREHICLYDAEKQLLYSGDFILPKITPHISLHNPQGGDPLGDYLEALEKIRGLSVNLVLPAHEWVFQNLDERILELERHHEVRCLEILEAMEGGDGTVFQISSKVSWDSRPWTKMQFWTKRMAAAETLAHLAYMRNRGKVTEENVEDVLYYRL
jgi:glyoxylase-like metal-dependent hydrolase (beta-lactamase superfamily II)